MEFPKWTLKKWKGKSYNYGNSCMVFEAVCVSLHYFIYFILFFYYHGLWYIRIPSIYHILFISLRIFSCLDKIVSYYIISVIFNFLVLSKLFCFLFVWTSDTDTRINSLNRHTEEQISYVSKWNRHSLETKKQYKRSITTAELRRNPQRHDHCFQDLLLYSWT